ncbi:hypothetical protein TorRG33x02_229090 [Trema orientale]|uniref:Uncharacterized protein n=1 Tax=Trema orientale TaxID=63057 RepID=A0A2P5E6U7_TREOI|nr:hypothetical protein TorRG33x02_229090 [Trema orientale]
MQPRNCVTSQIGAQADKLAGRITLRTCRGVVKNLKLPGDIRTYLLKFYLSEKAIQSEGRSEGNATTHFHFRVMLITFLVRVMAANTSCFQGSVPGDCFAMFALVS